MPTHRFVVTGRVQGVGFRDFVRRRAVALEVTGFARNLADGSVEVLATGSARQLGDLAGAVREGPPWGDVRSFHQTVVADETYLSFTIR